MSQVLVNVPESAPLALKVKPEDIGRELMLAAAVKLYEIGRLSSGAAAELAGISKPLFLQKLADYGVAAFRLNEQELRAKTRRMPEVISNTSPLQPSRSITPEIGVPSTDIKQEK